MAFLCLVPQPDAELGWPPGPPIVLYDDTTLGRGKATGIPGTETHISRKHCGLRPLAASPGSVELTPLHTVWLRKRGASKTRRCLAERGPVQMAVGDTLWLTQRDGKHCFGFTLEEAPAVPKRPASQELQQPGLRQACSGSVSSSGSNKRQRAAPAASPSSRAAGRLLPPVLAGTHIAFWATDHMQLAKQRAAEAGAIVTDALSPGVTHVVADSRASGASIARRLGQPLGAIVQLPLGVHFVSERWTSECIRQGRLLPPEDFPVPACQALLAAATAAAAALPPASTAPAAAASQAVQQSPAKREAAAAPLPPASTAPAAAASLAVQQAPPSTEAAASAATQQAESVGGAQQPAEAAAQGSEAPAAAQQVTGGDSGRPWGQGGHWVEPWQPAAAQETLRKLYAHWHRQFQGKQAASGRAAAAALQEAGSDSSGEGGLPLAKQPQQQAQGQPGSSSSRPPCGHAACGASRTCIVAQLKLLASQYGRSGVDQFRLKAVNKAMLAVETHPRPLRTQADVEALSLGKKSAAKVLEILETGELARNAAFLADPRAQTLALFASVWGVAEKTAAKWWAGGCRTLEDVKARTDLTEQQAAGLRHFADMQQKIPRAEALAIAGSVIGVMLRLFGWRQGEAHARAMGSLLRGKPATTDCDMLVVPPEREARSPTELMNLLLAELLRTGFLTDDMRTVKQARAAHESCTFLGFCRPPGSARVRRLDVKIYPRASLPFAVNYFTGSGPFNRALRYWAMSAPPAVAAAQQQSPAAEGFKLSDTGLSPVFWRGTQAERGEVLAGPPVPGIRCETDLFRALGLAYVPPHLRFFADYH